MTKLNPYINFKDNAKTAMQFYHSVLGGELTMTTFKEGGMSQSEADANLIMNSMIVTPSGLTLMASDVPPSIPYTVPAAMAISLSGDDENELRGYWDKLAEGANIALSLEKAPWGDLFGMLTDKFGIDWMVNITLPKA